MSGLNLAHDLGQPCAMRVIAQYFEGGRVLTGAISAIDLALLGLGRIVALCHHPSALYQIH